MPTHKWTPDEEFASYGYERYKLETESGAGWVMRNRFSSDPANLFSAGTIVDNVHRSWGYIASIEEGKAFVEGWLANHRKEGTQK
jgi:hypothetical protein